EITSQYVVGRVCKNSRKYSILVVFSPAICCTICCRYTSRGTKVKWMPQVSTRLSSQISRIIMTSCTLQQKLQVKILVAHIDVGEIVQAWCRIPYHTLVIFVNDAVPIQIHILDVARTLTR